MQTRDEAIRAVAEVLAQNQMWDCQHRRRMDDNPQECADCGRTVSPAGMRRSDGAA